MKEFIPKTETVNQDRRYYKDEGNNTFVKVYKNIDKGKHEAEILKLLLNRSYGGYNFPKFKVAYEENNEFKIVTSICKGETIENCKNSLSYDEKRRLVGGLLTTFGDLFLFDISHGDINESNVIFDRSTGIVSLVDFEMGDRGFKLSDIYGPPWGLISLLEILR